MGPGGAPELEEGTAVEAEGRLEEMLLRSKLGCGGAIQLLGIAMRGGGGAVGPFVPCR
jgi:hypothetical protein